MAIQVGRRIIFDKLTGKVIIDMGEMQGDILPRESYDRISYIDLPYGYEQDKFLRVKKWHIDISTGLPVFDELFDLIPTPEQKIAELQQQLLQAQGVI